MFYKRVKLHLYKITGKTKKKQQHIIKLEWTLFLQELELFSNQIPGSYQI